MLFRRVTLFRFFGFDIKADASWFFIAVLIGWTLSTQVFPVMLPKQTETVYQLMAVATIFGILVSIIAHEVAHGIIAEYYSMPVTGITLFIFGGVAEMKGEPSHPKGEFLMAVAGPAMSTLLGLLLMSWSEMADGFIGKGAVYVVFYYVGYLNLLIAGFNMIPAFPLDGGRALRAIIWQVKKNFVLATRIASEMGQIFAYGLLVYACYEIVHNNMVSGMWSGIFAFFMHAAGSQAVRQSETRSLLVTEKVSRFMTTQIVTVPPGLTISDLVDGYVYKHYQRSFPVVENGRIEGVITLQSILSLERHKWHWLHVASVMEPLGAQNSVSPDMNAADALEMMQKSGRDMLVVTENGKFKGGIAFRDLATYLSITMKMDFNRPVETSRGI